MGGATTCWQVFRPPSDLRLADFVFDDPHFHECVFDKHQALFPVPLFWRNFLARFLIGILPKKQQQSETLTTCLCRQRRCFRRESFLLNLS